MGVEKTEYQKREAGFLWFKIWINRISLSSGYFTYILVGGIAISLILTVSLSLIFPKIYSEHSAYDNYIKTVKTSEKRLFLTSEYKLLTIDETNAELNDNVYEVKQREGHESPTTIYKNNEGQVVGKMANTSFWGEIFLNEILDGWMRLAFVFFSLIFASSAGLYYFSIKKVMSKAEEMHKDKFIKGTNLLTQEELIEQQEELKIQGVEIKDGVLYDDEDVNTHMMMLGATGRGKSVILKHMYVQFKEQAKTKYPDSKFIIHDIKGDWIRQFYNPKTDFILNPMDERTINFNVFSTMQTKGDIKALCGSLVPQSDKGEPIWPNSTIDLLEGILWSCVEANTLTNEAVKYHIKLGIGELAKRLKKVQGAEAGYGHIAAYASSSQPANIFSNFITHMKFFLNTEENGNPSFDVKDWLKNGRGTIFLANFPEIQDIVAPSLTLFTDTVTKELLSMPENDEDEGINRRVYLMYDEFGNLNKLNSINKFLSLARSFGGAAFLGTQGIGGLQLKYGKEAFDEIVNGCVSKVFMWIGDSNTREYVSKLIGNVELEIITTTNSLGTEEEKDGTSFSTQRKTSLAVEPSEIEKLRKHCFYFKQDKIDWARVNSEFRPEKDKHKNIHPTAMILNKNFLINFKDTPLESIEEILKKKLAEADEEESEAIEAVVEKQPEQILPTPTPVQEIVETKKSDLARDAIFGVSSVAVAEVIENTVEEFKETEDDEDNFSSGFAEESEDPFN